MFDAIANPKRSVRSARSIALSIAMHCTVLGAALLLAWLHAHELSPRIVEVPLPPYRPGPPVSAPSGHKPMTPRPDRERPRPAARPIIEPREVPQLAKPPQLSMEAPPDDSSAEEPATEPGIGTGIIEGIPGGLGNGRTETAGPSPAPGPPEFNDAMTPPRRIAGPDPEYTREALEGEIEGTLVVKCVVTTQGTVRNCRVLKSLPFMDRAVTDALEKRRYTAALLRGQAIEVDYTFSVQLKLPQ